VSLIKQTNSAYVGNFLKFYFVLLLKQTKRVYIGKILCIGYLCANLANSNFEKVILKFVWIHVHASIAYFILVLWLAKLDILTKQFNKYSQDRQPQNYILEKNDTRLAKSAWIMRVYVLVGVLITCYFLNKHKKLIFFNFFDVNFDQV